MAVIENYTDKTTIKNWFKTGLKPTQTQFWSQFDSFWHKSESLPISSIKGLGALIDGKAEINHTHDQYATKEALDNEIVERARVDALKLNKPTENATNDYVLLADGSTAPWSDFGKVDSVNNISPDESKNVNIGLDDILSKGSKTSQSATFEYSTGQRVKIDQTGVRYYNPKNTDGNQTKEISFWNVNNIPSLIYSAESIDGVSRSLSVITSAFPSNTGVSKSYILQLPVKDGIVATTDDIQDIFNQATNWTNASQRFSGLVDKSADATFNVLMGLDSGGNLSKVNGKTVFMSQPDNLTEAEKTAWKTKMNGGYTSLTMNVSIITPNVIKKDTTIEKNIILRGSNLNINPSSFSISILNSSKTLIYTLDNSKVNLISGSELNFWIDTSKVPLNEEMFVKINNGVAEYITPIYFQLRVNVTDIDFTTLTWTKHYVEGFVKSGVDYAEGSNAGIEYDEVANSSLKNSSLVASFHSSNIANLLASDNFSISFSTSLQNLTGNSINGYDTVTPKVGIYIGDKPNILSSVISNGIYYNKTFSQTGTGSQIGLIGGSFNSTALGSPVEAIVTLNKQGSFINVSISFNGGTMFLVATFPFTPTNKIGFSMLLGGQLRRSNISIKNIQGYTY